MSDLQQIISSRRSEMLAELGVNLDSEPSPTEAEAMALKLEALACPKAMKSALSEAAAFIRSQEREIDSLWEAARYGELF